MTVDQVLKIFSYLGSFGAGALIAGIVLAYLLKSYLPAYLDAKGKNLATKEDIGAITEEIEKVKSEYAQTIQSLTHQNNLLIEEMRSRQQLRMAAVERRLQAHQEAYTHWRKLLFSASTSSVGSPVLESQDWWEKNCLYLGAEARDAFRKAYNAVADQRTFSNDRSDLESARKNWKIVTDAGDLIVKGAELPSLGYSEFDVIQNE